MRVHVGESTTSEDVQSGSVSPPRCLGGVADERAPGSANRTKISDAKIEGEEFPS
jgi:hypothetical protein